MLWPRATKSDVGSPKYCMTTSFKFWLLSRQPDCGTEFLEVSALFDRRGYNSLFDRELNRLRQAFPGQESKLATSASIDWVGYIARSLRNAGFRDHDIDPLTHEAVVRLLISPGGLFKDWDGQPVEARFKVAVRNAILNLIEKRRVRQRFPTVSTSQQFEPGHAVGDQIAARNQMPIDGSAIDDFRTLVRNRVGNAALRILDLRLDGVDLRSVVGQESFGKLTSYRLKLIVQEIKKLAEEFAQERGDESLLRQVRRAMAGSSEVIQKRVAGNKARHADDSLASATQASG